MSLKYLLDENVDLVYQTQLLRREPSLVTWRAGDQAHLYISSSLIAISTQFLNTQVRPGQTGAAHLYAAIEPLPLG
jgi:hypothetical protein